MTVRDWVEDYCEKRRVNAHTKEKILNIIDTAREQTGDWDRSIDQRANPQFVRHVLTLFIHGTEVADGWEARYEQVRAALLAGRQTDV